LYSTPELTCISIFTLQWCSKCKCGPCNVTQRPNIPISQKEHINQKTPVAACPEHLYVFAAKSCKNAQSVYYYLPGKYSLPSTRGCGYLLEQPYHISNQDHLCQCRATGTLVRLHTHFVTVTYGFLTQLSLAKLKQARLCLNKSSSYYTRITLIPYRTVCPAIQEFIRMGAPCGLRG